jgi:hypothetical protein
MPVRKHQEVLLGLVSGAEVIYLDKIDAGEMLAFEAMRNGVDIGFIQVRKWFRFDHVGGLVFNCS